MLGKNPVTLKESPIEVEEERHPLRREGDKIEFADFGIERRRVVGFWERRGKYGILEIASSWN